MQEELIVHGLKSRDEYYLEMLMKLYGKLVSYVIKKLLGPDDPAAVEEIARNLTFNYIKKNKKYKEADATFAPAPYASLDSAVLSGEAVSEILTIIRSLKEPYCKIFLLRYFYELEIDEIAHILSMNRSQIDNYLSRGRKLLKHDLFDESSRFKP